MSVQDSWYLLIRVLFILTDNPFKTQVGVVKTKGVPKF